MSYYPNHVCSLPHLGQNLAPEGKGFPQYLQCWVVGWGIIRSMVAVKKTMVDHRTLSVPRLWASLNSQIQSKMPMTGINITGSERVNRFTLSCCNSDDNDLTKNRVRIYQTKNYSLKDVRKRPSIQPYHRFPSICLDYTPHRLLSFI